MQMGILVKAIRTPQSYSMSQSGDYTAWLHHTQTLKIVSARLSVEKVLFKNGAAQRHHPFQGHSSDPRMAHKRMGLRIVIISMV